MASKLKTLTAMVKVVANPAFWRFLQESIRVYESRKYPPINVMPKGNILQDDAEIISMLFVSTSTYTSSWCIRWYSKTSPHIMWTSSRTLYLRSHTRLLQRTSPQIVRSKSTPRFLYLKFRSKNIFSKTRAGVHVYVICNVNRKQASQIEVEYVRPILVMCLFIIYAH